MMIFGAQIQAKPGRGGEAGAKVAELRDSVSAAVDMPVHAWAIVAGAPTGAYGLSSRVDGTGHLIDTLGKLSSNEHYQKLAAETADLWAEPTRTTLSEVIATAGDPGAPSPIISVTTATIAFGHMQAAMTWGTEVLEHVAEISGLSGMLTTASAGNLFDMSWIFGSESGAAADAANAAIAADAGYFELIDRAAGHFVEGTTHRALAMQMP
jgi:hypothetical protein